jgi:hypothetical protein
MGGSKNMTNLHGYPTPSDALRVLEEARAFRRNVEQRYAQELAQHLDPKFRKSLLGLSKRTAKRRKDARGGANE